MPEKRIYEVIEKVEKNHWWYAGRRKILAFLIKRYFSNAAPRILSVGCGPGIEIKFLERYGTVTGLDSSPEMLNLCRKKKIDNVVLGKAQSLPFPDNSFDLVAALDVIEYVEDDFSAIKEVHRVLKKGGVGLITLPALRWLRSDFDKLLGVSRRYNRKDLEKKLKRADFSVRKLSYFNTFLFLPIVIMRKIKNSTQQLNCPPGWLNKILKLIFGSERFLLGFLNFPFGISLIAVVAKI